ncbi:hypothetical protein ACHAXT_008390 [Thalassiosira profunda]
MNIQLNAMTAKDYSFEPVGTVDPASAPPVVEAVPTTPGTLHTEEEEDPSDTAIMVGCGLMGWLVGGPFFALLGALGGKYAADKNQGPTGESTKAVGRIAASAGRKAREENLGCKIRAAIRSLFGRKKECHCQNCEPTHTSQCKASNY